MALSLSIEQAGMLRDELTRLKRPNDPDQIRSLRAMREAVGNKDQGAFLAAWKGLDVGFGVRLTPEDFLLPRMGVCGEQLPSELGGPAEPEAQKELNVEAQNELRPLMDYLDAIAPQQPQNS